MQGFLETLTAQYAQPGFKQTAEANGFKLYSGERGAPENIGEAIEAVHPVVRTNPVTGWKSVSSTCICGDAPTFYCLLATAIYLFLPPFVLVKSTYPT